MLWHSSVGAGLRRGIRLKGDVSRFWFLLLLSGAAFPAFPGSTAAAPLTAAADLARVIRESGLDPAPNALSRSRI